MSPRTIATGTLVLSTMLLIPQLQAAELSGPQVQNLVEDALREGAQSVDGRIEQVLLRKLPTVLLPTAEHRVKVHLRDGENFVGATPVELRVEKGGQVVKRMWVNARIIRKVPLLRLANRVPGGQLLKADDLEIVEVDASRRPSNALTQVAQAVGMATRTTMAPGRALTRGYVQRPVAIKRGARVGIEVVSGNLRIRAQGRAERSGGIGEMIPVLNLASKRSLQGRIQNANTVVVEP